MKKPEKSACQCPYCGEPAADESQICRPCSVKFAPCRACGKPFAETAERCPECGAPRRTPAAGDAHS